MFDAILMISGWLAVGVGILWMFAVNKEFNQIDREFDAIDQVFDEMGRLSDAEYLSIKRVYNLLDVKYPGWRKEFLRPMEIADNEVL